MDLQHVGRRVDLVQHHRHDAERSRMRPDPGIAGDADGGEEIARSIRRGERGIAHCRGHDHRDVAVEQQIEQEGRLFQRVGALRDDDAVGIERGDLPRQRMDLVEAQGMAADPGNGFGADVGQRRERRHGGHEIVGAQPHLHGARRVGLRGDGAAEGQDANARQGHVVSLRERKKRSASGARMASAGAR